MLRLFGLILSFFLNFLNKDNFLLLRLKFFLKIYTACEAAFTAYEAAAAAIPASPKEIHNTVKLGSEKDEHYNWATYYENDATTDNFSNRWWWSIGISWFRGR